MRMENRCRLWAAVEGVNEPTAKKVSNKVKINLVKVGFIFFLF
jgi:hypothetical protein